MYFPTSWNSRTEITPTNGLKGAGFGFKYPEPEIVCDSSTGAQCSNGALKKGGATGWYSNFTFIPGTGVSMSEEMYSPGRCFRILILDVLVLLQNYFGNGRARTCMSLISSPECYLLLHPS